MKIWRPDIDQYWDAFVPAKYPLIVFAPGDRRIAIYNPFMTQLASRGYVVIAPIADPCLKAAVN